MFRTIKPQVAGFLGNETVVDMSTHPPIVHQLDYEFNDFPKDDILETFPCYIVTERLKIAIEAQALTGVIFDDVINSQGKSFKKHHPDAPLPKFYWLKAIGIPREADFAINDEYILLISDRVYSLLTAFDIKNAHFQVDRSE